MKKLVLATGLFLSLGFMASAQEKKAAAQPATAATVPTERVLTADEQRNKKKLTYIRKQKTTQKNQTSSQKSTKVDNRAKEVKVD